MLQNSFAVYTSKKYELDLHINVWTDMKKTHYIDIGCRIYKNLLSATPNIDDFNIYIPYKFDKQDIVDLSKILKNETNLKSIFNQKCSMTIFNNKDYYDIKFADTTMRFFSINLCIKKITEINQGIIINFHIPEWGNNDTVYIRFRLPYKSLLISLLHKKHWYFEALSSPIIQEKHLYNFKINEFRTLPKQVSQNINNNFIIKTVKFFICIPDRCSIESDNIYKTRILEKDFFKTYIPIQYKKLSFHTYQWNKENKNSYIFSDFIIEKKVNFWSIVFYTLTIVLINIISNICFKFIEHLLDSFPELLKYYFKSSK